MMGGGASAGGGSVVGVGAGLAACAAAGSSSHSRRTKTLLLVLPLQLLLLLLVSTITTSEAFHPRHGYVHERSPRPASPDKSTIHLQMVSDGNRDGDEKKKKMERPFFDRFIASTLFRVEMDRVKNSSVSDEKGRVGEPMEWSQSDSIANQFSELVAGNDLGYQFKQWVADIVAGNDYDQDEISKLIDEFIVNNGSDANILNDNDGPVVAMFSFTTCPFCRRAKDLLESKHVTYKVMELDELEGNRGNEIRAMLGRKTRRTSVPSIFIDGQYIGGCNDGNPGLIPLEESGQLDAMLQRQT